MNKDFKSKFRAILNEEAESFFDALLRKRERFFRINSARNINYLEELETFDLKKDPLPHIYSCNKDKELTNTISFLTGGIYIQNPSSIIPPLVLAGLIPQGSIILDAASAPGGKTTALSELTRRKAIVIANESSPSRLKSLHFNLEKYGAYNVHTISFDGRILNKKLPAVFDGILLDAPCSNENKIGFSKEVDSNWCMDLVHKMQKLQYEIILSVKDLLRPGGVLVYSTCTFSVEENEEIIKKLLDEDNSFELIDINKGKYDIGISTYDDINDKIIRVFPHRSVYDGFFIAALRKKGEYLNDIEQEFTPTPDYLKEYTDLDFFEGVFSKVEEIIYLEKKLPTLLNNIKYKKTGLKAGKLIKNQIELSSQFVWEFGSYVNEDKKIYLSKDNSLEFLNGFDIPLKVEKNKNCLFYGSIPVGVVKNTGDYLKNKLDRYFLYGKG